MNSLIKRYIMGTSIAMSKISNYRETDCITLYGNFELNLERTTCALNVEEKIGSPRYASFGILMNKRFPDESEDGGSKRQKCM